MLRRRSKGISYILVILYSLKVIRLLKKVYCNASMRVDREGMLLNIDNFHCTIPKSAIEHNIQHSLDPSNMVLLIINTYEPNRAGRITL